MRLETKMLVARCGVDSVVSCGGVQTHAHTRVLVLLESGRLGALAL